MGIHKDYLKAARRNLEAMALRYARMKLFGFYLNAEGNQVRHCGRDRESLAQLYRDDLAQAAESLLAEIALTPLPPDDIH